MSLLGIALREYEEKILADSEKDTKEAYIDRRAMSRSKLTESDFRKRCSTMLRQSNTLYIGNMSIWTREEQLWRFFQTYFEGTTDIVMGINRTDKTSAGFCFVVFENSTAAHAAYQLLRVYDADKCNEAYDRATQFSGFTKSYSQVDSDGPSTLDDDIKQIWNCPTILDDRPVRVDFDRGGDIRSEGRYWGRGYSGGQVRDEYRSNIDMARGGANARQFWEARQCNQYIPSMSEGTRKRSSEEVTDQETPENNPENQRPVYDWLKFNVNQWKYKVKTDNTS